MEHTLLGKKTIYHTDYDPALLFPIARSLNRDKIGVSSPLPFVGIDIWNHYEVSWLNAEGKPIVAVAEFDYDCDSPYIIESKSMKLYFNSLNNTCFESTEKLQQTIQNDIETHIESPLRLRITPVQAFKAETLHAGFNAICLDDLNVSCSVYELAPDFLSAGSEIVTETVCSNLMKSNCLVTGQPDWGSLLIEYHGKQIDHTGLLRYIVSYRNSHEFSETCVERVFVDIMRYCAPESLTIYGRFTRRGGLDINPIRSTDREKIAAASNLRFCRQ